MTSESSEHRLFLDSPTSPDDSSYEESGFRPKPYRTHRESMAQTSPNNDINNSPGQQSDRESNSNYYFPSRMVVFLTIHSVDIEAVSSEVVRARKGFHADQYTLRLKSDLNEIAKVPLKQKIQDFKLPGPNSKLKSLSPKSDINQNHYNSGIYPASILMEPNISPENCEFLVNSGQTQNFEGSQSQGSEMSQMGEDLEPESGPPFSQQQKSELSDSSGQTFALDVYDFASDIHIELRGSTLLDEQSLLGVVRVPICFFFRKCFGVQTSDKNSYYSNESNSETNLMTDSNPDSSDLASNSSNIIALSRFILPQRLQTSQQREWHLQTAWYDFYPRTYHPGGYFCIGMKKNSKYTYKLKATLTLKTNQEAPSVLRSYFSEVTTELDNNVSWTEFGLDAYKNYNRLLHLQHQWFYPFFTFLDFLAWLRCHDLRLNKSSCPSKKKKNWTCIAYPIYTFTIISRNILFLIVYVWLPWSLWPIFLTCLATIVLSQNRHTNSLWFSSRDNWDCDNDENDQIQTQTTNKFESNNVESQSDGNSSLNQSKDETTSESTVISKSKSYMSLNYIKNKLINLSGISYSVQEFPSYSFQSFRAPRWTIWDSERPQMPMPKVIAAKEAKQQALLALDIGEKVLAVLSWDDPIVSIFFSMIAVCISITVTIIISLLSSDVCDYFIRSTLLCSHIAFALHPRALLPNIARWKKSKRANQLKDMFWSMFFEPIRGFYLRIPTWSKSGARFLANQQHDTEDLGMYEAYLRLRYLDHYGVVDDGST